MDSKFFTGLYSVLEKQGVGVLIVVVIIAWMSGILPFKLFCLPPESAQERATRTQIDTKIAEVLERMYTQLDRIDKRDHIEKCARIADKTIRDICLEISVPGGTVQTHKGTRT